MKDELCGKIIAYFINREHAIEDDFSIVNELDDISDEFARYTDLFEWNDCYGYVPTRAVTNALGHPDHDEYSDMSPRGCKKARRIVLKNCLFR